MYLKNINFDHILNRNFTAKEATMETEQNTLTLVANNADIQTALLHTVGIDEKNIRHATAPLSTAEIREFFENKELFYLINYSKSKLKGAQFLTYTTNLALPGDVRFNEDFGYDEYAEIMRAYFNQSSITELTGLHILAAHILLLAKGIDEDTIPYQTIASTEWAQRFYAENKEQLDRWLRFFDSAHVFALYAIKRLRDHYDPLNNYEAIEDRAYVGANAAALYKIPEFIFTYYFAKNYNPAFFVTQFTELAFKGSHLSQYFTSPHNPVAFLMEAFATGEFKASEVEHPIFQMGVFSPEAAAKGIKEYVYDPNYVSPTETAEESSKAEQSSTGSDVAAS